MTFSCWRISCRALGNALDVTPHYWDAKWQMQVVKQAVHYQLTLKKLYFTIWGEGWLGFLDLCSGQKPWLSWYLTPSDEFRWSPRAQLAKSTLLTSTLVPLGSFQICSYAKDSGVRKATGSYRTYSIPGKTATLVPVFAVEDLNWTELQAWFLRLEWRTCPWAEHSDDVIIY